MLSLDVKLALKKHQEASIEIEVASSINLDKQILGIFGPSGCGKSSLLKFMAGLLDAGKVVSGSLHLDEADISKQKPHLRDIAMVGQRDPLYPHMTVAQNLDFVRNQAVFSVRCTYTKADVINWCGIAHLLAQPVTHLSGGETQRVLFARALLCGKSLLLLDESFSALDWHAREEFLLLLVNLQQNYGLRFIVVSHSLKELALSCDHIWQIKNGRLVAEGTCHQMLQRLSNKGAGLNLSQLQVAFHSEDIDFGVCRWHLVQEDKGEGDSKSEAIELYTHLHKYQQTQRHLVIEANKVVLSTSKPFDSSMLNQLSGQIVNIDQQTEHVLVTLEVAGQALMAEISRLSYERLALAVGQSIYAQFKLI